MHSALWPWSPRRATPIAVRGEGVFIYADDGQRYLDGSGGAVAVTIGHAVPAVVASIHEALTQLPYVHSSHFRTQAGEELAQHLVAKFPRPHDRARVIFTSGGSEAIETALKLARLHWVARGHLAKTRIVSRWQSYHGATLGALGVSGHVRRRSQYVDMLPASYHAPACFCYRCPLELTHPDCALQCAAHLEAEIVRLGPETVAAVIVEPIVGATSGAVPAPGYLARLRDICDRHDVLLIADEVMTGAGRTGRYYAMEHWDVIPDLIVMGKGLSSGYAPLGAVVAAESVCDPVVATGACLEHSFTYQAHPPSVVAALTVQRYVDEHRLVDRAARLGEVLERRLRSLATAPGVGDIRGKGLLWTVEFVADPVSRRPFAADIAFSERVFEAARRRGVLVYPGKGTADGVSGDHILIAPPFVITEEQVDILVAAVHGGLREALAQLADLDEPVAQAAGTAVRPDQMR